MFRSVARRFFATSGATSQAKIVDGSGVRKTSRSSAAATGLSAAKETWKSDAVVMNDTSKLTTSANVNALGAISAGKGDKKKIGNAKYTLKQARRLAHSTLANHKLDADLIVAHLSSLDRTDVIVGDDKVTVDRCALESMLQRRLAGEPLAYITCKKEFYGQSFVVSNDVLVPRPDTEILVEKAIEHLRSSQTPRQTFVDVCTGSGCVGLSVLVAMPEHEIRLFALDVSSAALNVARRNARLLLPSTIPLRRTNFLCGDLLEPVRDQFDANIDLIVANPPYIRARDYAALALAHEPAIALIGEGDDGLGHHRRILTQSVAMLRSRARVLLEIGDQQQAAALSSEKVTGLSFSGNVWRDLAGKSRVVEFVKD
jgi:release factor glutamine methyltransferase